MKSSIILATQDSTPRKWDWKEVVRRNSTVLWEFVPVGAAHRNGLAESTVKILKRCLKAGFVTWSCAQLFRIDHTLSKDFSLHQF